MLLVHLRSESFGGIRIDGEIVLLLFLPAILYWESMNTSFREIRDPETGRKSLFVNPGFTVRIKGLSAKESDTLLDFLYAHMATPEYVVRYRWDEGDLGFWDNRTTQHYAITDYGTNHRVIQRVTLKGDRPY